MAMKKTYFAPAKINLNLMITDRLDNGFHLLDSLVYFSKLVGDTLHYDESQLTEMPLLSISGNFSNDLDTGADNLICRAAHIFQNHHQISKIPTLHLEKKLPIASGIGGGSSDAAAVIHLLSDYFDKEITAELIDQLCNLGADIPVCIAQNNCHMAGIGEKITPLNMPDLHLILINPLKTVSTPEIFKHYRHSDQHFSSPQTLPDISETSSLIAHLKATSNDLQSPAMTLLPCIQGIISRLEQDPNCLMARMSGSGATCFGIYTNQEKAKEAMHKLQQHYPNYWIVADYLMS